MNIISKSTLIISGYLLAACTTATTAPMLPDVPTVGMANNTGGSYTIVTNGVTHNMTGALTPTGNSLAWNGALGGSTMKGSGFETADVLALSAMNIAGPNETFAGITGTLGTVATSGTATYSTQISFQLLEPTQVRRYGVVNFAITADFGAATISGSGTFTTSVQGDIVGSEFTGTVGLKGLVNSSVTTVPLQGGFYGANGGTIAGAFAGDGLSGVFGGLAAP